MIVFAATLAAACGSPPTAKSPTPETSNRRADDRVAGSDDAKALATAEDVLDAALVASGGRAAHERLTSRVTKGTFSLPKAGASNGSIELWQQAPNKSFTRLDIPGIGKQEQGTDGTVVWERAMTGARVLQGGERTVQLRAADFHGELNWKQHYTSAKLEGVVAVNGAPAYKIVMTPKHGKPETRYYDKQSKLLVKSETTVSHQMGELTSVSELSDYRKVDGVMMPFKTVVKIMGMEQLITLTEVKHNVSIPADKFDVPAEIKALLDKK